VSEKRAKFVTVSIPADIGKEIDELMKELGYWPSRSAFAREACLEKIREERRRLKELRESEETPSGGLTGDQPPLKRKR